jgi:hypothetical protein
MSHGAAYIIEMSLDIYVVQVFPIDGLETWYQDTYSIANTVPASSIWSHPSVANLARCDLRVIG